MWAFQSLATRTAILGCFWIAIALSVPVWWSTTTIERRSLPRKQVQRWEASLIDLDEAYSPRGLTSGPHGSAPLDDWLERVRDELAARLEAASTGFFSPLPTPHDHAENASFTSRDDALRSEASSGRVAEHAACISWHVAVSMGDAGSHVDDNDGGTEAVFLGSLYEISVSPETAPSDPEVNSRGGQKLSLRLAPPSLPDVAAAGDAELADRPPSPLAVLLADVLAEAFQLPYASLASSSRPDDREGERRAHFAPSTAPPPPPPPPPPHPAYTDLRAIPYAQRVRLVFSLLNEDAGLTTAAPARRRYGGVRGWSARGLERAVDEELARLLTDVSDAYEVGVESQVQWSAPLTFEPARVASGAVYAPGPPPGAVRDEEREAEAAAPRDTESGDEAMAPPPPPPSPDEEHLSVGNAEDTKKDDPTQDQTEAMEVVEPSEATEAAEAADAAEAAEAAQATEAEKAAEAAEGAAAFTATEADIGTAAAPETMARDSGTSQGDEPAAALASDPATQVPPAAEVPSPADVPAEPLPLRPAGDDGGASSPDADVAAAAASAGTESWEYLIDYEQLQTFINPADWSLASPSGPRSFPSSRSAGRVGGTKGGGSAGSDDTNADAGDEEGGEEEEEEALLSERILHFIVYVPSLRHEPLGIRTSARGGAPMEGERQRSESQSWLVPQWGGVYLFNPSEELVAAPLTSDEDDGSGGDGGLAPALDADALSRPMRTVRAQLSALLGLLPLDARLEGVVSREAARRLAIDALLRRRTLESAREASRTLAGIVRLVDKIPNLGVGRQVQRDVATSLRLLEQLRAATLPRNAVSNATIESGADMQSPPPSAPPPPPLPRPSREPPGPRRRELLRLASRASSLASRAFFDPGMLGQLYFPEEHKYAVYTPLFGPVSVPLAVAALRLALEARRRWRGARAGRVRRRR